MDVYDDCALLVKGFYWSDGSGRGGGGSGGDDGGGSGGSGGRESLQRVNEHFKLAKQLLHVVIIVLARRHAHNRQCTFLKI